MEAYDTNPATASKIPRSAHQWIGFLLIFQLIGFLFGFLAELPIIGNLNFWIQLLVSAVAIFALFSLKQYRLYRPAAILLSIFFVLTLLRQA